jgi:hypothetical protein
LFLSIELFDGAYGSVSDVVASVPLSSSSADCWKITSTVKWQTGGSSTDSITSDPVFIEGQHGSELEMKYLPGSTVLLNSKGKRIMSLANGVAGGGVSLPYIVPPAGLSETGVEFIHFELIIS